MTREQRRLRAHGSRPTPAGPPHGTLGPSRRRRVGIFHRLERQVDPRGGDSSQTSATAGSTPRPEHCQRAELGKSPQGQAKPADMTVTDIPTCAPARTSARAHVVPDPWYAAAKLPRTERAAPRSPANRGCTTGWARSPHVGSEATSTTSLPRLRPSNSIARCSGARSRPGTR